MEWHTQNIVISKKIQLIVKSVLLAFLLGSNTWKKIGRRHNTYLNEHFFSIKVSPREIVVHFSISTTHANMKALHS